MNKKTILTVDDEESVHPTLHRKLESNFPEYSLESALNVDDALEVIRDIDNSGDRLALVITDQKMPGKGGDYLIGEVKKTHPKTKTVLLTGYSDNEATVSALNHGVDFYSSKPVNNETFFPRIELLLKAFETGIAKHLFISDEILLKVIETSFEREKWFEERFRTYVEECGHLTLEDLTEEQIRLKQEFDKFDLLPSTTQVGCFTLKDGNLLCIGGSRLMVDKVAIEEGLSLEEYRKRGVIPQEASRFIVNKDYRRRNKTILFNLVRFMFDLGRDKDITFCTSQNTLYEKFGFTRISANFDSDSYELRGEWIPYVLSHSDIFANSEKEKEGRYRNFAPVLYNILVTPILSPQDVFKYSIKFSELFRSYDYWRNKNKNGKSN